MPSKYKILNRSHLKIIACASMLLDHAGLLLFPGAEPLRWAGRLAMPLFAFFIGEGCRYTRNRKKYFLSVFLLGVGCQLVYVLDGLIETGNIGFYSDVWYLNILLAFSVSIPLCCLTRDLKAAAGAKDRARAKKYALLLALGLSLTAAGAIAVEALRRRGAGLDLDYGIWAILLPLSAAAFDGEKTKTAAFAAATLAFCAFTFTDMPYVWFSLASPALLLFYNGKGGSRKLKYVFYIFYPAHLAALYLIALIIS